MYYHNIQLYFQPEIFVFATQLYNNTQEIIGKKRIEWMNGYNSYQAQKIMNS